jgi:UDP-GlcNAc:undecaprenyl-phosphate GlcNAc-1-phosphate transferase
MGLAVLAAFLLAFALAAALSPLARALAVRLGFLDRPDLARKAGRAAVPYGGGAAMLLAMAGAVAGLWILWRAAATSGGTLDVIEGLLPDFGELSRPELRRLGFIGLGSLAVFAAGLYDDARRMRPLFKFGVHVLAALLLVAGGVRLTAFVPSTAFSAAITVLWVAGITNAFNLLDNMDGLSAGTAAISAFVFAMVAAATGQPVLGALLAALAGAAAGFLTQNFHPARMYMGDAGSCWLGFTLSALSVEATFYRYTLPPDSSPVMLALGVPLLIMAVPIFDTASVLWIRLREGRPPWVGDRSHLSHRLVEMGLSVREAVLAIWLLTLACGLGALLLKDLPLVGGVLVLAQAAAILAVVAILEGLGRRGASRK